MSTHVLGFQPFFSCFASFCIGQICHQQAYELVDRCVSLPVLIILHHVFEVLIARMQGGVDPRLQPTQLLIRSCHGDRLGISSNPAGHAVTEIKVEQILSKANT